MSDQDRPRDESGDQPTWPEDDAGAGGATPSAGGGVPPPPPPSSPPPPPSSAPAGQSQAGQTVDLGLRFLARLIDHVLLAIVSAVLIVPIIIGAIVDDVSGAGAFGFGTGVPGFVAGLVGTAITLGYFTFMESSRGQTVGKQLLKIRTVGPAGGNPTVEQAFRRNAWYLLGIVPLLGGLAQLVVVIIIAVTINSDPANRGKHDEFAGGTAVVRT